MARQINRGLSKRRKFKAPQFDLQHYTDLREQLADQGPIELPYAELTETNLNVVWDAWTRYCRLNDDDPVKRMDGSDAWDLMTFWNWYLDHHNVKSKDSLDQYRKRFALLYKRHTGRAMDGDMEKNVRNYVKTKLKEKYKLKRTPRRKAVMSVDDLLGILRHHWVWDQSTFADERQRVQLATLLLLAAYTGQRPCTLLQTRQRRKAVTIASSKSDDESDSDRNTGGDVEANPDAINDDSWGIVSECCRTAKRPSRSSDAQSKDSCSNASGGSGDDHSDDRDICASLDVDHSDDDSNPGSDEEEDGEDVCRSILYKHIKMLLLRGVEPKGRPILVMQVKFIHTKGEDSRPQPKRFFFYENDNLMFCPVAHILALATHDGAFEVSSLHDIRNLFVANVPPHKQSCRLRWRDDIMGKPIFRQATRHQGRFRTSDTEPLQSSATSRHLKRLGLALGYQQPLTHYCVRRGTGNAVDNIATAAERDQIMGHSNSRIFQHYLNEIVKCDVQAAFLGQPSQKALMDMLGRMSLTADPKAPTRLTGQERQAIEADARLLRWRQSRDMMSIKIRDRRQNGLGNLRKLKDKHGQISTAIDRRRKLLRDRQLARSRREHFRYNDSIELEAQFSKAGSEDSKQQVLDGDGVKYALEERRCVAEIFYASALRSPAKHDLSRRIDLVAGLTSLCGRREAQRRAKAPSRTVVIKQETEEPPPSKIELFPVACHDRQCLFCLGDESLSHAHRTFKFSRRSVMWDHIESHYPDDVDVPIACPHPVCSETCVVLKHLWHFKNHAMKLHKIRLRI